MDVPIRNADGTININRYTIKLIQNACPNMPQTQMEFMAKDLIYRAKTEVERKIHLRTQESKNIETTPITQKEGSIFENNQTDQHLLRNLETSSDTQKSGNGPFTTPPAVNVHLKLENVVNGHQGSNQFACAVERHQNGGMNFGHPNNITAGHQMKYTPRHFPEPTNTIQILQGNEHFNKSQFANKQEHFPNNIQFQNGYDNNRNNVKRKRRRTSNYDYTNSKRQKFW